MVGRRCGERVKGYYIKNKTKGIGMKKTNVTIVGLLSIAVMVAVIAGQGSTEPDKGLRKAAYEGDVAQVTSLIKAGAPIDFRGDDFEGLTALELATVEKHLAVVKELLRAGAKVNEGEPYFSMQSRSRPGVLYWAVLSGSVEIMQELIKAGAQYKKQALKWAQASGNEAMVALLKAHVREIPLHIAAHEGNIEKVKELVKAGADINERDEDQGGITPLFAAILDPEMAIELIRLGADANVADAQGNTPLILSLNGGHRTIAHAIIEAGGKVNAVGIGGITPLMIAAGNGYADTVKLLLDKGADVNARDAQGRTTFDFAAYAHNKEEIVAALNAAKNK
jgi:ankyrin repeat protein